MKLSTAINGYTLAMLADGMSPHTINGYQWAFNRWVNYMNDPELEAITTQELRHMFASLQDSNLASSSIQSVWRTMRSFYNWAEQDLEIKRPDKGINMPRVETRAIIPFTEDEIKRLLLTCEKSTTNTKRLLAARDRALILLLLDTGLRIGEACRLTINDYTPETGELVVSPYRSGRKSKARTVYLGKRARKSIWLYLATREISGKAPLFVTRDNNPITRNCVKQLLEELSTRTGIKHVHPHRFRHTFAIQYLRNGGDVFTLQRLLGHRSLEMVRKYILLADSDTASTHARASPADRMNL